MAKRKGISKKVRFEVFKRDSFTCQYCGRKSPDIVLEIDHIKPVSKGGNNGILNLITSCFDCNRGKSDRELSTQALLNKKRNQLEVTNERVEQMKMMLKWQEELLKAKDTELNYVLNYWYDLTGNVYSLNTLAKNKIRGWLRDFGTKLILEAIEIAVENYCYKSSDSITCKEFNNAFNKIKGICYNKKGNPHYSETKYLLGIVKNRLPYFQVNKAECYIKECFSNGYDFEKIKDLILYSENNSMLNKAFNDLLGY
jgi:CRISPR/Cas system Type II protein with McrA/HNH and RuvC-like nuclease domain